MFSSAVLILDSKRPIGFRNFLLGFFVSTGCHRIQIQMEFSPWQSFLKPFPRASIYRKEKKTVLKTENIFFYFILPSPLSPSHFTTP